MKSQLYPLSSDTLSAAASRLRAKDFEAALKYAEDSPACGVKDFITGIAAYRAGNWSLAATSLATAAKRYELLADYALYYQAQALKHLEKSEEALAPLAAIQKLYPQSPLLRSVMLMIADIQYTRKDFSSAATAFQKFIEKYPSGSDAIGAQFRLALCLEATGDTSAAVKLLRNLWLASPASSFAPKAEEELKRMETVGVKAAPYTTDELFRRASTLFELKKFTQAATDLKALPRSGQSTETVGRMDLKTGQALYRARKYKEAEQYFIALQHRDLSPPLAAETTYWLARTQDRCNRDEDAIATFLQVAERWPTSGDADNALLEAALIRKSQKRWTDVKALADRILSSYPETSLRTQAWWEAGWSSYQTKDWPGAAAYFRKLSDSDTWRDRALYWLSRAQAASGDKESAEATYAKLQREYPLSYYSVGTWRDNGKEDTGLPAVSADILETLPLPANFERTKALISFGMLEEARKELSSSKGKNGSFAKTLGIARLYLEIDDYNGAYNLVRKEYPSLNSKEWRQFLALKYPLPFRDIVLKNAETSKVSPQLVYAVIRSESSFSPVAVSPVGAVGLMQLMPATAGQIEGKATVARDRLTQPGLNINYGVRHFKDMLGQYNGDMISTIASYNAGGTAVNRWKKEFAGMPPAEFVEQIPYGETREYVKQVLASSAIYSRLYSLPSPPGSLPLPPGP
jgi:soluble lytic murein transglycosylase